MSEKLSSIFENSPHLSRSEMMDYLSEKLSGAGLRRAELHLADCDFCADALEGLKMLSVEDAEKILDETNEAVQKIIQPKRESVILIRRWIAIAAVSLLLIVSSFFINYYLHEDKNQVAQEIMLKTDSVDQPVIYDTDKGLLKEESKNNGEYKTTVTHEAPAGNTNTWNDNSSKDISEEQPASVTMDMETDKTPMKPSKKLEEKENVEDLKLQDQVTVTDAAPPVVTQGNESVTLTSTGATDDEELSKKKSLNFSIIDAKDNYDKNDYSKALKDFKKAYNSDKNNYEAAYYAGVCEFNLKEYNKALTYFDAVLVNPINPFFTRAQWQKSLTLIAKGDKPSAEILLNKIIAEAREYKDSAAIKISKMK